MADRIKKIRGSGAIDVNVRTFHSFGLELIRRNEISVPVDRFALIYDDSDQRQLMRDVMSTLKVDTERVTPRKVLGLIESFKRRALLAEDLDTAMIPMTDFNVVELYDAYQKALIAANALDFGDLLLYPVRALKKSPIEQERLQKRFRFIMVDEFQDTNHIQYELMRLLVDDVGNLAVVGDDDQSIYAWRGADISNILNFEQDYASARVIKLEQNYRSTEVILNAAWEVVRHNIQRKSKRLWTDKKGGALIKRAVLSDEREEGNFVAQQVKVKLTAGAKPSEIAVFYRTNAQSRPIEEALRQLAIPYRIVGATGFYARKEVKDVLAYLRLIHNAADVVAFSRIVNVPRRGIGKTSLQRVVDVALEEGVDILQAIDLACDTRISGKPAASLKRFKEFIFSFKRRVEQDSITNLTAELIRVLDLRQAYLHEGEEIARDRRENIDQLLVSMQDFEQDTSDPSLANYLDLVSLVQDVDQAEESSVQLMTLHSAKGLEFDIVLMCGLEYGLLPHTRSIDEGSEEEERRLCYVGMTRARQELFLTRARTRRTFGAKLSQQASPFLTDIPAELTQSISPQSNPERFPYSAPMRSVKRPDNRSAAVVADDIPTQFQPGASVVHPIFGIGRIESAQKGPRGLKLKICFTAGTKTILPSYVELKPVSN
ncbi:ATP-dependent DNA helicase PcrA-like [Ylistrum balloti]|uniref:ATP-dependent DNA helicase PcrA-like n=1 Tax=Ylistrum balloti TaxID=509963 RepID=UPI002905AA93|nr:ATP-dependent DNA helicase PcrA-like [Ylistrum balloti]